MKFKTGIDRHQTSIFPVSLDATISQDNEVRLIDLFVEFIDIVSTHFIENGRPTYHQKDLLKLFIYGYLNKIRSSKGLEKESKRNIEVMWLLNGLSPDRNISSC
ncbi:transposase [uncultured Aquimarina sp.]|uniref:transposase n=1 Tax=uncultured Aquimarina sp. TaxID=575652 RepID=UPI002630CA15|nr:transposase [uncultured Aquimarina sp.]